MQATDAIKELLRYYTERVHRLFIISIGKNIALWITITTLALINA